MQQKIQRCLQSAAVILALGTSTAYAAPDPTGIWIDHTGRGAVEITQCGGNLCGRVVWLQDAANGEACGQQILGDVKPVGSGVWDRGWIFDPDRGEKFDVEIKPLSNGKLKVTGYAGVKFLSETMTWTRAPADIKKCGESKEAASAAPAAEEKPTVKADAETSRPTAAPETLVQEQATEPQPSSTATRTAEAADVAKAQREPPPAAKKSRPCKVKFAEIEIAFPCPE